jgi:hypothetical protein
MNRQTYSLLNFTFDFLLLQKRGTSKLEEEGASDSDNGSALQMTSMRMINVQHT